MRKISVAVIQNSAGQCAEANLRRLERFAAGVRADILALPEVFALRGADDDYRRIAQPCAGQLGRWAAALARRKGAWLLAGSIIERSGKRFYNTSLLFDRRGVLRATYRKIHLFEARLEDGRWIRERDLYAAGRRPCFVRAAGWPAGLAICYDLRFPELFRLYSRQGALLFFLPSNFTQRTGKDHWETLVRARAIENQCFVIAPNQCGANPATGVVSYGHSLVAGPWGEILAVAGDEEAVITAALDPELLRLSRTRVPAWRHRAMG